MSSGPSPSPFRRFFLAFFAAFLTFFRCLSTRPDSRSAINLSASLADQLRDVLAGGGHTELPDDVRTASDPFDVLFYAAKLGQDEPRHVEAAFRAHEVEAVQSAAPTPATFDLIRRWKATGRQLAIVSNNSTAAVETYFDLHDLRAEVDFISARASADTSLLKPNPHLVTAAARSLNATPSACTLVGDSLTDVEAAHAAGVLTIAYANKPGKTQRFLNVEPAAVTTTIALLVEAQG